jgi:probable F420-dependent oxidoreductase
MPIAGIQIGAVFPHFSIGADRSRVRQFVTSVEELGFDHLLAYDHVIGGSREGRPELEGRYTSEHPFHELFVLFGFVAGATTRLGVVSSVFILPQRQTALVAKQAAEVDILLDGRFRLGVGIGWNAIEYQALNEDFRNRGRRFEEQIDVLRQLFTNEVLTVSGKWHTIDRAGIQPLPIQRPIPIWIGGSSERAVRRAGRIADGFFPNQRTLEEDAANLTILRDEADRSGRDLSGFGIEPRINLIDDDPDEWKRRFTFWRENGATHISLATIVQPSADTFDHLERLQKGYWILEAL